MYKSFTAKNYRCFADLTVEPLERVNLIAGKNNVGKTALLEALWIHHGYYNSGSLGIVNIFRGLEQQREDEFMWDLFSDFDPTKTIELSYRGEDDQLRSLQITVQEQLTSSAILNSATTKLVKSEVLLTYNDPSVENAEVRVYIGSDGKVQYERPRGVKKPSGVFLASRYPDNSYNIAEAFSRLAIAKKESKVVQTLQIIEPRLKNLTVQHRGGGIIIHGDIGRERLTPLALMGDGMVRLLEIALAIATAHNSILLIDEIENGLHHTVMQKVWQAIARLAREYDVQIFATTHSEECIRAAHQAFAADDVYDFALHRLEWARGAIRAVTFDQETLDAALEIDVEVR